MTTISFQDALNHARLTYRLTGSYDLARQVLDAICRANRYEIISQEEFSDWVGD